MTPPKIKLPHPVIVKSPGLLPMLYSVRELAQAIGIAERTLRDWLTAGAPHLRDNQGHLWINGREFAGWVALRRKPGRERKLKDSQAYCMRCKQVVELLAPQTRHIRGKLTSTRGTCSRCSGILHRGGRIASNPTPHMGETAQEHG
jgi:hypothetical protein